MAKYLYITILIFFTNNAIGQINTFIHIYGGQENDEAKALVETHDYGYAIVGATSSISNGNSDILLFKINNVGELQWSKVFGREGIDWGYDLKQTADSGFIVVGYSNSYSLSYDIVVLKTDSMGNLQWQKNYGGNDWEFGYGIDTTSTGYIVCGETYSYGNGKNDFYILNLDFDGDTIWTKTFGTESSEKANDIITTYTGEYVAVGHTKIDDENENFQIVQLTSDGDTSWTKNYGNNNLNYLNKIVNCQDSSSYALAGTKFFNSNDTSNMYIAKIDTSGILIWEKEFGDSKVNYGNSVFERSGSSFILCGEQNGNTKQAVSFNVSPAGAWWNKGKVDEYRDEYYADAIQPYFGGGALVGNSNSFDLGYSDILFVKTDNQLKVDSIYYEYTTLDSTNTLISGIQQQKSNNINIYHNGENELIISNFNSNSLYCIEIYDILGKNLKTLTNNQSNQLIINTTGYNNGVYIINIRTDNEPIQSTKFLIR